MSVDENLLDDLIGSKDQAIYDKLLSAGDFDEMNSGAAPIQEVEVETVAAMDYSENFRERINGSRNNNNNRDGVVVDP